MLELPHDVQPTAFTLSATGISREPLRGLAFLYFYNRILTSAVRSNRLSAYLTRSEKCLPLQSQPGARRSRRRCPVPTARRSLKPTQSLLTLPTLDPLLNSSRSVPAEFGLRTSMATCFWIATPGLLSVPPATAIPKSSRLSRIRLH